MAAQREPRRLEFLLVQPFDVEVYLLCPVQVMPTEQAIQMPWMG